MNRLFFAPIVEVEAIPPTPFRTWAPIPGTVPILVEDHVSGLCRWTVHDGPPRMLWCGQPTAGHVNYCPVHLAVSTRPTPVPDRKLGKLNKGNGKIGMIFDE